MFPKKSHMYVMVKNIPGMENDNIEVKKKGQDHDGVTPTSGWPESVGAH